MGNTYGAINETGDVIKHRAEDGNGVVVGHVAGVVIGDVYGDVLCWAFD